MRRLNRSEEIEDMRIAIFDLFVDEYIAEGDSEEEAMIAARFDVDSMNDNQVIMVYNTIE
jgi:hypothetical protein